MSTGAQGGEKSVELLGSWNYTYPLKKQNVLQSSEPPQQPCLTMLLWLVSHFQVPGTVGICHAQLIIPPPLKFHLLEDCLFLFLCMCTNLRGQRAIDPLDLGEPDVGALSKAISTFNY